MMSFFPGMRCFVERTILLLLFFSLLACPTRAIAQATGVLRGQVLDPSGAVVPGASVTLSQGATVLTSQSGSDGAYSFKAVAPGSYTLAVEAPGFATVTKPGVVIAAGLTRQQNLTLTIAVQQQDITVNDQSPGVSLNPDEISSALVVNGTALDALWDA